MLHLYIDDISTSFRLERFLRTYTIFQCYPSMYCHPPFPSFYLIIQKYRMHRGKQLYVEWNYLSEYDIFKNFTVDRRSFFVGLAIQLPISLFLNGSRLVLFPQENVHYSPNNLQHVETSDARKTTLRYDFSKLFRNGNLYCTVHHSRFTFNYDRIRQSITSSTSTE